MLEGIKGALRSVLSDAPAHLSVVPERKSTGMSFDAAAASLFARNGYPRIAAALMGGTPAWSGEAVSNGTALGLSTVYACNKIISESKGLLPIVMTRTVGNRSDPAADHPMYGALLNAPNCEQTAQTFTELLTTHCVMSGGGFAQILRRSGVGTAVGLYPILPENVAIDRDLNRRLVYVVKEANQPDSTYTVQRGVPQGILHLRGLGWDGLRGYSVIRMAQQSIGTALAQERNVANFYAAGGRVPYILETSKKFESIQDFDAFRADWKTLASQSHEVPILEDDLKYKQIGLSAVDAQLLESRQFTIPEICRWFSVSPHMVADLSKATNSNIEAMAEQFVRFTLMTWLTRWEQELWRCVLTPDEQRSGLCFKHDLSVLLKADFQARMQGYATLLQNGVDSINEVRIAEGKNPIPGGDDHRVQVNLAELGTPPANGGANAGVIKQ